MAPRISPSEVAENAIRSIGRGFDVCSDLRLKACKPDSKGPCLIELDHDQGREVFLPGGISIPNVSKSIKCDKGERMRFRSDVLPFQQVRPLQLLITCSSSLLVHNSCCRRRFHGVIRRNNLVFSQMAEQFNKELSLSGKIPSGLFNHSFRFSGSWQKDASATKGLAFDGCFITLYTIALAKSQIVLRDHVTQAVPTTWDPSALAR